jgi:hypothetical protein
MTPAKNTGLKTGHYKTKRPASGGRPYWRIKTEISFDMGGGGTYLRRTLAGTPVQTLSFG